jgi:hypothetical protein
MDFPAYRHIHQDANSFFSQVPSADGIRYKCEICDVQLSSWGVRKRHEKDETHQDRMLQIIDMQENGLINECAKLQCRLDGLSDQTTVAELERKLYRVLLLHGGSTGWPDAVDDHLTEVDHRITDCEQAESLRIRMLLLQLAAWKAMCLGNPSKASEPKMTYHEWHFWSKQGWKARKQDMKDVNEIGIIVRAVRPFIG